MNRRVEVFHLLGHEQVDTVEALGSVLRQRSDRGNHFEISPSPAAHPLLTLMVRDDYAVLHFFESGDEAGWQSRGNLHAAPAVIEFLDPAGAPVTLPSAAVVDLVTAERCVDEFAGSLVRPRFVDWLRL